LGSESKTSRGTARQPWEPVDGQWIIARTDAMIKTSPVDVYVILEAPSLYIHGFEIVTGEGMTTKVAEDFLRKGFETRRSWPPRLAVPKGDPCGAVIARVAQSLGIQAEELPRSVIEARAAPFLAEFAKEGFSASPVADQSATSNEAESARAMIPDSYDLCPCGSGAKYKFCCKRIFREVVHAMAAAEEGDYGEALRRMKEAEKIAGSSAEVLCRFAIVYSYFDKAKSESYLRQCLEKNPKHPRAHYLLAIKHRQQGEIAAAIGEYEKAIENYPKTDRFHLNEAWNNVGTAYYEAGNYEKAKEAWETAITLMPSDEVSVRNLLECICRDQRLPPLLREPSALVREVLKRRGYL
jgi:tetratricopeptide (TPR) repeat protein